LVRFRFYKPETEKPSQTGKNQAKTESNQFKPVFIRTELKPVSLNQFWFF
jgi:hypothetical protein